MARWLDRLTVLRWWLTSFWRRCHCCGDWASFDRDVNGLLWCSECKFAVKRGCECSRPAQRRDWLITVHAYGLTERQRDALFTRVADAAHARDEEVTCSMGPLIDEDRPQT